LRFEAGGAAECADCLGAPSKPLVRDPQVEVAGGIRIVDAQGRLVVRERIVEHAVFEQQIADVDDHRHAACIRLEPIGKGRDCRCAFAAAEIGESALVVDQRALGVAPRARERGVEMRQRGVKTPPLECGGAGGERRFRRLRPSRTEQSREERHPLMLHVDVVTLFPEMFAPVIGLSIVGRAVERGLAAIRVHDIVAACEPGARADERPFGGGPGMVLRIEPLAAIIDGILAGADANEVRRIILTSASGPRFGQSDAQAFAVLDRLILVCGHYEGIDERLSRLYPVEERSLGDFVLTGGEIPALAFLDATVRLIDGVISAESRASESFVSGDLDYPAYTRPPVFRGVDVPAVLLSGDHAAIAQWRRQRSRERAIARNSGLG
jgi:tRNA (guanine37-N1)-methyltransferase